MINETQPRKPSHRLFSISGEGDKARWMEIGAAWPKRDGEGFTLRLDAFPLNGKIVMRTPKAENGGQQ